MKADHHASNGNEPPNEGYKKCHFIPATTCVNIVMVMVMVMVVVIGIPLFSKEPTNGHVCCG